MSPRETVWLRVRIAAIRLFRRKDIQPSLPPLPSPVILNLSLSS